MEEVHDRMPRSNVDEMQPQTQQAHAIKLATERVLAGLRLEEPLVAEIKLAKVDIARLGFQCFL